jgi:5-methylcytosine-specific restriction endonuclease McrA
MPIKPENKALYPKDWKAIRAEVLGRAQNKCESCGAPNRTCIERYSDGRIRTQLQRHKGSEQVHIVLTIAHLDHDPTNNGEPGNRPNLRALCQQCHNRHDAKMRAEHARATRRSKVADKELF